MKKMKILLFVAAFSALSCSSDNDANNNEYSNPEAFAPVIDMNDNINLEITTDKAINLRANSIALLTYTCAESN